ncbi:MAG: LA_1612 family putative O-antigen biosynthesis protein [Ilumatobacteraceae bacterium]
MPQFTNVIKRLVAFRFTWRIPKSSAILILDAAGADLIRDLCGKWSTQILDREELNIPVLLAMLMRGKRSMHEYQNSYIRRCTPRIVITLIDNDMYFMTIKKSFPSITTIAIQNGVRANYSLRAQHGFFSLLKEIDSPSCDYYCVFNKHVGEQLTRFIETVPVVTGSIKNNEFLSKAKESQPLSIAFISQYPPRCIPNSSEGLYFDNAFVSDHDFYQADFLVAKFLARYCSDQNFKFIVCGKRDEDFKHEYESFSKAIGDQDWTYVPRKSDYSSYETLDAANIVVSIDSTVGYEFFARGKRTAFFSIRGSLISEHVGAPVDELNFGWPLAMASLGPFWTNTPSESEFVRVLDYLTTVEDNEWTREIGKYTDALMVFDQGNTVLRGLLQHLGAKLIEQEPDHA